MPPRSLVTDLKVENFRCFKKLHVAGLTRVNVVVGRNNAGKTALLECVEAVVSEASPFVLYRPSFERGESHPTKSGRTGSIDIDVRHWFHGHKLAPGTSFKIEATGDGRDWSVSRSIERVPMDAESPPFVPGGLLTRLHRPGMPPSRVTTGLPLQPDGSLGAGEPSGVINFGLGLQPPVAFMTTQRVTPAELATMWAGIVLTPREESTLEALRLVEPTIDRIAMSGSGDAAAVHVLLRAAIEPVPLGTLGEGVSRVLALAVQLASAQGGFLLIDEIENGLHWSVMPRVWRFLLQAARDLDVQIFASTHSKDCLEAIASLYRTEPALAADATVHRLEAGREESVRIDARIVDIALEGAQEVR